MTTTADPLEETIEKLRNLPADKQALAAVLIEELVNETDVYDLRDEELEILETASAEVKAGNYATAAEVAHAFRRATK